MTNETDNTTPTMPEFIPPRDPADAGGVGNGDERIIRPGTLVETAEEAEARGSVWRRGTL